MWRATDEWNYLRVRGEYCGCASTTPVRSELPPRARRIRHHARNELFRQGTTSACAENTVEKSRKWLPQGNYLRVRGEYCCWLRIISLLRELPPRARRIRKCASTAVRMTGTTSACAENTYPDQCFSSHTRNYLRVRGEYCGLLVLSGISWELPPRARRIPHDAFLSFLENGTTSACAENTAYQEYTAAKNGNYLRVRGEYIWAVAATAGVVELPPRARRIRDYEVQIWANGGTTSACAENTRMMWGV